MYHHMMHISQQDWTSIQRNNLYEIIKPILLKKYIERQKWMKTKMMIMISSDICFVSFDFIKTQPESLKSFSFYLNSIWQQQVCLLWLNITFNQIFSLLKIIIFDKMGKMSDDNQIQPFFLEWKQKYWVIHFMK